MRKRKVTLPGFGEFEVIDEEQLMADTGRTGRHIHVVSRVSEMDDRFTPPELLARRFKVHCVDCQEVCWFDPKSSPAPGLGEILCIHCMMARIEADQLNSEAAD